MLIVVRRSRPRFSCGPAICASEPCGSLVQLLGDKPRPLRQRKKMRLDTAHLRAAAWCNYWAINRDRCDSGKKCGLIRRICDQFCSYAFSRRPGTEALLCFGLPTSRCGSKLGRFWHAKARVFNHCGKSEVEELFCYNALGRVPSRAKSGSWQRRMRVSPRLATMSASGSHGLAMKRGPSVDLKSFWRVIRNFENDEDNNRRDDRGSRRRDARERASLPAAVLPPIPV